METLIGKYKKAKEVADRVKKVLWRAIGDIGDKDNKGIRFSEYNHGYVSELKLYVTFYNLGDYIGNDRLHEAREYLVKAINEQASAIAYRAADMAAEDAEKARVAARTEAEEILKHVA